MTDLSPQHVLVPLGQQTARFAPKVITLPLIHTCALDVYYLYYFVREKKTVTTLLLPILSAFNNFIIIILLELICARLMEPVLFFMQKSIPSYAYLALANPWLIVLYSKMTDIPPWYLCRSHLYLVSCCLFPLCFLFQFQQLIFIAGWLIWYDFVRASFSDAEFGLFILTACFHIVHWLKMIVTWSNDIFCSVMFTLGC